MARPPVGGHDVDPSEQLGDRSGDLRHRERRSRLPSEVGTLLSRLSFWGAIVLPVVYLPLLAVGIDDASRLLAFLWLFGLHVVTLIAGRSHRADSRR